MSSIRKMDAFEKYFSDDIKNLGAISVSVCNLTTKVDLFDYQNSINESVKYWQQTQPFLCSRVTSPNELDSSFEYMSNEQIRNSSNISYLYFKRDLIQQSVDNCKNYVKLLVEREFTIPIDVENGPLWRIMFIKTNESVSDGLFNFDFIITSSHCFFDGQSIFVAIVNLFSIIDSIFNGKLKKEEILHSKVAPSIEEIIKNQLEDKILCIPKFKKLNGFNPPNSFMVKNTHTDRLVHLPIDIINNSELNGAFYSSSNNQEYFSLKNLVELSQNSVTKMHFMLFTGDALKKFLAACKSNNAKVTSVINMMFVLGWRIAYEKLNEKFKTEDFESSWNSRYPNLSNTKLKTAKSQKITYSMITNLRNYLKSIPNDMLAWMCTNIFSSFEKETNIDEPEFWQKTFWEYARIESENLHSRLEQGEQFQIFDALEHLKTEESRVHFRLSNLILPSSFVLNHSFKNFYLYDIYNTSSRINKTNLSYVNVINYNERLQCILSYNSYLVKNETIKIVMDSVTEIFGIICENYSNEI